MQNPYQTLGVNRDATGDDIKRAYRKLASKHHPDRGGDTKTFQEIQTAYDTLSDPQRRAAYDNPGFGGMSGGFRPDAPFDFETIFNVFGARFNTAQQPRTQIIRMSLWVSLRDVAQGGRRTISIGTTTGVTAVEIEIPLGIDDGEQVQYNGIGPGGANLVVQFRIHPDGRWQRNGLNVITEKTVSIWDLILGAEAQVEDVLGNQFKLQIPSGCQPGTMLRLKNQGLANKHNQRGDLLIRIQAQIPGEISQALRDQIEQERHR